MDIRRLIQLERVNPILAEDDEHIQRLTYPRGMYPFNDSTLTSTTMSIWGCKSTIAMQTTQSFTSFPFGERVQQCSNDSQRRLWMMVFVSRGYSGRLSTNQPNKQGNKTKKNGKRSRMALSALGPLKVDVFVDTKQTHKSVSFVLAVKKKLGRCLKTTRAIC